MELASMLAGEPFSDHPRSACPVIGSFLRAYNDRVDDDRRQDLYRYAAEVVGTRSPGAVQEARADHLRSWARDTWSRRLTRRFLPARWRMIGIEPRPPVDLIGVQAVRAIWTVDDRAHANALRLIDELLAIRDGAGMSPAPDAREDDRRGVGAGPPDRDPVRDNDESSRHPSRAGRGGAAVRTANP